MSDLTAQDIKSTIAPVVPFTDNDEAFSKGMGYSILAMLWGKTPGRDNVDYRDLGWPQNLPMTATDQELEAALAEQQVKADEVYGWLMVLLDTYGPTEFLTAVLSDTDYAPFWYVAVRWDDAVDVYGPNPNGLAVRETAFVPGQRPTFSLA